MATMQGVQLFTDTDGVDETEELAVDIDRILDNVTGRSVDVADDRFILVQQGV